MRDAARLAQAVGALSFGTKAETLEALAPRLRTARILPQVRFSVSEWRADHARVLAKIAAERWSSRPVIVRSSAQGEDGPTSSQAGRYDSVLGVLGSAEIAQAIEQVIASFADGGNTNDQVFVQPMLERVAMAGVAFSRWPSGGGPYYIVNYDDRSGRTDRVTGGVGDNLETFLCLKSRVDVCPPTLAPVIALVSELEGLFACDAIDVEFAIDGDGQIYLLQVRRLSIERQETVTDAQVNTALADVARKVELLSRPHPFLHGSRSIFGVMPDWNPAEIIGLRPWPLSLVAVPRTRHRCDLGVPARQLRLPESTQLPAAGELSRLPYIDVRVSFNSFIPRDVPSDLAARLVNYYIDRLLAEPQLHDKVEFEIIFRATRSICRSAWAGWRRTASRRRISLSCRARCGASPIASSTVRRRCGGATGRRSICWRSGCRRSATPRSTRSAASIG
jgi:hypothetical protein